MADRMIEACEITTYIKENCWPNIVRMNYKVDEGLILINNISIDPSHEYVSDCTNAITRRFPIVKSVDVKYDGEIIIRFGRGEE